jgi:hypothetical protein
VAGGCNRLKINWGKYEKALFINRLRNRREWKQDKLRSMLEDAQIKQKSGAANMIGYNNEKIKYGA